MLAAVRARQRERDSESARARAQDAWLRVHNIFSPSSAVAGFGRSTSDAVFDSLPFVVLSSSTHLIALLSRFIARAELIAHLLWPWAAPL